MKDMVAMRDGTVLVNVHTEDQCAGEPCCIHNPSNHHMATWPHHWNGDSKLMQRSCPHAFLHPDPDALSFRRQRFGPGRAASLSVHDCDGCCQPFGRKEIGA